jgi:hypothetical protein
MLKKNLMIIMITKFDKYKQIQFVEEFGHKYEVILQKCENSFHDDAQNEVDWYINELMNLYINGGEVYRIVSLKNKKKIDDNNLGNHWTSDEGMFDRIYGNILPENPKLKPYVITAYVKPKSVNVEGSLSAFEELPEEGEIYIDSNVAQFVSVKKYKM